jgi:hypothetical protein
MSRKESRREWLNRALAGSAVAALGGTAACKRPADINDTAAIHVAGVNCPGTSPRLLVACHGMMAFDFTAGNGWLEINIPEVLGNGSTDPGHVYRAGDQQPNAQQAIDDLNSPYMLKGPTAATTVPPEVNILPNVKLFASGRCSTKIGKPYCKVRIPMPEFYLACRQAHDTTGQVFSTSTPGTATECGLSQLDQYASVHVFGYSSVTSASLTKTGGGTHWDTTNSHILHIHAELEKHTSTIFDHLPHLNGLFTRTSGGSSVPIDLQFRSPADVKHVGEQPPNCLALDDLMSLGEKATRGGNPTNCMGYMLLP